MIRKDPMYCGTCLQITRQPASTTSTVVKVVSRMRGMEMPSTPSRYQTL